MQLNNSVESVRVIGGHVVRVGFADGYVGEIDLGGLFEHGAGPLVEDLRDPAQFHRVTVENGTVTFANGYDICPDVLRFYCERGGVTSQAETDAAFAVLLHEVSEPTAAVAEAPARYGSRDRRRKQG